MSKPVVAILANFPYWLFNEALPKRPGHYAVWLVSLHQALEGQQEFDIHWVTLSKDIKEPCTFTSHGQQVHVLPRARLMLGLYTAYWYDRHQVAKLLRRIKPDMVHSWGTEECYGLCACDFKGLRLHSVQGLLKAYMERGPMGKFETRHSFYEPKVLRTVEHLTTESPWAADRVRDTAPGADPFFFEYAVEERFFRMQHTPAEVPTCLYAGSGAPIKNVGLLVEAFSAPELAHVQLNMAGIPKSAYPHATTNIHFLGRVGRDEMARLLAEAWCLVHPSLADTGPTIVKEARVVGVPAILTTECGSKQHVVEGKSGFVISPHDKAALIDRVLKVTASRENAVAMGAYGQEDVRRDLSATTMVDRLLEIYRTIFATE